MNNNHELEENCISKSMIDRLTERELELAEGVLHGLVEDTDDSDDMTTSEWQQLLKDEFPIPVHDADFAILSERLDLKQNEVRKTAKKRLNRHFFEIVTLVLIVLLSIQITLLSKSWPSLEIYAWYGDSFGVINSLASALALCAAVYTIHLQRRELSNQRRELRLARRESRRSANAHEKSIDAMDRQISLMATETRHGHTRFLNQATIDFLSKENHFTRLNAGHFEGFVLGGSISPDLAASRAYELISCLSGLCTPTQWMITCERAYSASNGREPALDCDCYLTVGSYIEGIVTLCELVPNIEPPLFWFNECMRYHSGHVALAKAFDDVVKNNPNQNILFPFDARKIVQFTINESSRRRRKNFLTAL